VLGEIEANRGATPLSLRRRLALEAFSHTAAYDATISAWLRSRPEYHGAGDDAADFPRQLTLTFDKAQEVRYGENPHQAAAVYRDPLATDRGVLGARQLHGKELSYNNVADAAAALALAQALSQQARRPAAAVIKHANPCGAGSAGDVASAVGRALEGDRLAAFGGILAVAGVIDDSAAALLTTKDTFLEVVIAEGFSPGALESLRSKSAAMRLLETGPRSAPSHAAAGTPWAIRGIPGGLLVQEADVLPPAPSAWTHAAGPALSGADLAAGASVELMVRAMNSNAIALGLGDESGAWLVGGGVGQVDRVTACRLAVEKAGPRARGAIAVSDAFFPFPDGPQVLIDAGARAIIHPGGSKRDQETFDLCAARGVSCYITGVRRFRH
jgi:phosphoribosylaminoimidazolecarboxamide formyltransferase/IMP cyclohydrolase